jgi:hypothetical protein
MTLINTLEYNVRYRLLLNDNTTVDARYIGGGLFVNESKTYNMDDIKSIDRKLPS